MSDRCSSNRYRHLLQKEQILLNFRQILRPFEILRLRSKVIRGHVVGSDLWSHQIEQLIQVLSLSYSWLCWTKAESIPTSLFLRLSHPSHPLLIAERSFQHQGQVHRPDPNLWMTAVDLRWPEMTSDDREWPQMTASDLTLWRRRVAEMECKASFDFGQ